MKDLDEFDELVKDLQEKVDQKDREDFSEYAISLVKNPYKLRRLEASPTVISEARTSNCGDRLTIFLDIKDHKICDVGMVVDGCATNIITGSQVLKMIDAKSVDDALKLTAKDMKAALGKFPEANFHCIALAIDTLRATLQRYLSQTGSVPR